MPRIEGALSDCFRMDVKRFYLPDIVVLDDCPRCGKPSSTDMGNTYLSYPKLNKPESVNMYCETCFKEWECFLVLRLSVEIARGD